MPGCTPAVGHGNRAVGQRRAAQLAEVELQHAMRGRPQRRRDACRRLQLGAVALAVIERQAVAGKALLARQGKDRGGIEAAGKKDDCG
jgi:hypothetical protein